MMSLYPFTAAARARPIPVLPELGSINVSPGLIRPSCSASSIIRTPIRSFKEPPGLKNSHLANNWQFSSVPILPSFTIGVFPTASRIELCIILYTD